MALSELTSKNAVLRAMKEFDLLGRDKFLRKYRFGHARSYFLVYKNNQYDSKAIVGAAHGFQKGKPLRPKDFSGGKHAVQPKLERLGFSVVAMAIDDSTSAFPNEVPNNFWEGARLTITVNRFERSAKARLACIGHHGTKCSICSFDFGDVYGEEFAGFIHVHHIKPRNQINRRYEIDFIKDLVPVCPNCHAAIHYGNRHRSVVTIQKIFRRQKMKM